MKLRKLETSEVIADQAECTDFVSVDGEVYAEDELPFELVDDLPEVIDEDMLYEEHKDRELFNTETGQPKQQHRR